MSSDKTQKVVYVVNRSVSPMFLLMLLFLFLKLTGYVSWAWYWVFAPLWAPPLLGLAFAGGVLSIMGLVALVGALIAIWLDRK